jgi:N-methylhydantoinase A
LGRFSVAVDVGGTFIDVVLADALTQDIRVAKVLHRRGAQGDDIVEALRQMVASFGANLTELDTFVLGTTVVTNALLEGTLAKTALLTTEGFRDVLEIARMTRPSAYDPHRRRATPVVPRHRRFEVRERLTHAGKVLQPLDEASVSRHLAALRAEQVEAVAVSLLYSFVDPAHERRVRDLVGDELDVPISLSSEILPVFREYERTTATAINAATTPLMRAFLDGLSSLGGKGTTHRYIMSSSGGCLTFPEARRFPVKCATSGPAGGVIGAFDIVRRYGIESALTLDVGGTSSDVAMLRGGSLPYTDGRAIAGYPIALSGVEVETVGAGGGSIASIDPTGLLKVGPRSAGARPGPVCYRAGGVHPTVTDAHLALNRLGTQSMLSGGFALDRDAAVRAIEEQIAKPLQLGWVRTALGIVEVATANIVRAVRTMSVERGHDPRRMTLIAFGGAGPLHAIDVARTLEIPEVIVPAFPGVWSAVGILSADIQYSVERTWLRPLDCINLDELQALLTNITSDLMVRAEMDGMPAENLCVRRAADLRFRGQSHSLTVDLPDASTTGLRQAEASFRIEHELRYGHAPAAVPVELVNVRVIVERPRRLATPRGKPAVVHSGSAATRPLWLDEASPVEAPVIRRETLPAGCSVAGPAVVEQYDSTIVLGRGDRLEVMDDTGTARIKVAVAGARNAGNSH